MLLLLLLLNILYKLKAQSEPKESFKKFMPNHSVHSTPKQKSRRACPLHPVLNAWSVTCKTPPHHRRRCTGARR